MDHGKVKRWCKGRQEGQDDPLLGTKIAPFALDYESAGKRLGTRQNTYTPMGWTQLASHWCLKMRDGKKETRRRP